MFFYNYKANVVAGWSIVGILISLGIFFTLYDDNEAEAHWINNMEDCFGSTNEVLCNSLHNLNHMLHYQEALLQEEKKQTALLDHIDCVLYITNADNQIMGDDIYYYDCGEPLNYTGVWKP